MTTLFFSFLFFFFARRQLTQRADAYVKTGRCGPGPGDVRSFQRAKPGEGRAAELRVTEPVAATAEAAAAVDQHPYVNADDDGDAAHVEVHEEDALKRRLSLQCLQTRKRAKERDFTWIRFDSE